MSKVTSSYPAYSNSAISLGGSTAKTGVTNGTLNGNYAMSDAESAIYNYALNTLANILPSVNTFDPNTQSELQSEVDAYQNKGVKTINDLYNSSLKNLENDAVSRFGNLDNSIFTDDLEKLSSERSNAVSSFAQSVLSKQNELQSDELTQRYALIKLLSGLSDDIYSNALQAISTALTGSSSANNYNSELYDALESMSKSNSSSGSSNSLLSGLLGLTGSSESSSPLSNLLSLFK